MSDETDADEWTYEMGDQIADPYGEMPGMGTNLGDAHDYTIRRRVKDVDMGKRLYYVEDTEGRMSFHVADSLRLNFEKVGEEGEDE